jgi:DNA uptake protein ComE-like DNA-binding protein
MIGKSRAEQLVKARPFRSWEEVEKVPGFSKGLVDDLKSGGAELGSEEEKAA